MGLSGHWIVMAFAAWLAVDVAAADDVFVRQLNPNLSGGQISQRSDSGGAFVRQLPASARPVPPPSAPVQPVLVARNFISPRSAPAAAAAQDAAAAQTGMSETPAVRPYETADTANRPVMQAGTNISLIIRNAEIELPNVGYGVLRIE